VVHIASDLLPSMGERRAKFRTLLVRTETFGTRFKITVRARATRRSANSLRSSGQRRLPTFGM